MLSHSKITINLNCDATRRISLDQQSGQIYFDGEIFEGLLVFTGMLDALFDYVHGELLYRSLQFVYERHQTNFTNRQLR